MPTRKTPKHIRVDVKARARHSFMGRRMVVGHNTKQRGVRQNVWKMVQKKQDE